MFQKTIALSRASSKIIIRLQMRLLSSRLFPVNFKKTIKTRGRIQRGEGVRKSPTPGESQVAIGFLTNTGTDPPLEAIGPLLLLEDVDDYKGCQDLPDEIF